MEEPKPRGPPPDEIPKNPLLRSLNKKREKQERKEPEAHNAVEAALQEGQHIAQEVHAPKEAVPNDGRKVAIITGASSGIGKAIAIHLASSNYNVVLVARKKDKLHEVEQELAKYTVKVLIRECDVTKTVQVHETVQHVVDKFKRIDVLVNSAGYGVYGPFETTKLEDVNGQMVTNYFGTVLFTKGCLAKLKESRGVIINIASMAGLVGVPQMTAYSASKFAIVGFSESLRYELQDTGVSVCCVCPGKVKTSFFQHESFKDVPFAQDEDVGIVPSAVAQVVDKAIKERKSLYLVPERRKWEIVLAKLLPESFVIKQVKKEMKQN